MLSRDEVLKIARLARLQLKDDEISLYQTRLSRVLEYISELRGLTTEEESFVRHIPKDAVAFREDRVVAFSNVQGLLENAPSLEETSFHLPAVLGAE